MWQCGGPCSFLGFVNLPHRMFLITLLFARSTLTCKITSLTLIPIPAMVKKEPEPEGFLTESAGACFR